jgi:DNA-binding XRE family transcriptional regulator
MHRELVDMTGKYRGRQVRIQMKGFKCSSCTYATIRGRDMEEFRRLLKEEFRRQEQLVGAADLRHAREAMNATQKTFAHFLDIGIASMKRLEGGSVPERLMNEHIRARLFPEQMETVLQERLWNLTSLTGALAELPNIGEQCSLFWRGVSDSWNHYRLATTNYDGLIEKAISTYTATLREMTKTIAEKSTNTRTNVESSQSVLAADTQLELAA